MTNMRDEIDKIKRDMAQVSKISAELARAKMERKLIRTRIVAVVLGALLVLSNLAWYVLR